MSLSDASSALIRIDNRSKPMAMPIAGRFFPPSWLQRLSYLPPPKYAFWAPRSSEIASKTKPV